MRKLIYSYDIIGEKKGLIQMKRAIPLGVVDYEKLRKEDYYFADKSMMIQDFLKRKNAVTLITRPRRFGKTLNMSMMAEFFDITKDSKEIFKDTNIMKTEYAAHMNQYPMIFISFANAKGNKKELVTSIKKSLFNLYRIHDCVLKNLDYYDDILKKDIEKNLIQFDDGNLSNITDCLSFLMSRMERYYGKKVMVFIDEYDTPFIEAHVGGFYDEIRSGLAGMLHNALKTSTSLQYAMMTGIQRVAKENIFSDLNNLVVCTVKDEEYSEYFGFTEKETEELLHYYDLELNEEVKRMYDGYRFGSKDIYNPWSIVNYASKRELEPYWVNTSSNQMIRRAMRNRDRTFNNGYEYLIQNGYLETRIQMMTSFFEINTTASLWGLFVNAGYLTIADTISLERSRYVVRIPNQEVQQEFQNLTSYYLHMPDTVLDDLFDALRYKEKENFQNAYEQMLMMFPSYYDLKDENSYHVLMLGMCAWMGNEYEIISNREEGKGRCDLILKARKSNLPSYIMEFKYLKKKADQEELSIAARQAVKQIAEKQYDADIKGDVIYIGLAHHQKDVAVEWEEIE